MTSDTSPRPVSPLRARMIEDTTVRGFNEHTRSGYVQHCRAFAAFIGRSPDTATAEDLRFFSTAPDADRHAAAERARRGCQGWPSRRSCSRRCPRQATP